MRISDWSSDVCSSDLEGRRHCCPRPSRCELIPRGDGSVRRLLVALHLLLHSITHRLTFGLGHGAVLICIHFCKHLQRLGLEFGLRDHTILVRSEEHTSELQSLMRISYAVFCLKKKK